MLGSLMMLASGVSASFVPASISRLALQNPKQIYAILFRTAANTLLETAADPRLLGASIGFLAVLHTWGQNLHLHPHLQARTLVQNHTQMITDDRR